MRTTTKVITAASALALATGLYVTAAHVTQPIEPSSKSIEYHITQERVQDNGGSLPECEHEDGSSQETCVWYYTTKDGQPRELIQHNYGEWAYYPNTDKSITWDSMPDAETVRNAAK